MSIMECSEESSAEHNIETKSNNIENKITNEGTEDEGIDNVPENSVVENAITCKPKESEERLSLRKSMLEHLSVNDKIFFRSLNENEQELKKEEKLDIAEELLDRSYGIFLAKFGNYLLKEHLSYFENRSEEDSLIVDLHLKQISRALEQQSKSKQPSKTESHGIDEEMEISDELSPIERSRLNLRNNLLDHLSMSKDAHFKSQQVGEPDLDKQEKREIAEELLGRSASVFLARFGTHLLVEHLAYFDQTPCEDSYEVEYYLKQLRKTHCQTVSKVGIKNRRFEALKKMVEEGSYFCETEMRNRNPLLYEQLVGRFLSAEERKERLNNIDTTNITFVNLLLEQQDREAVKKLKKEQEEEEEDAMEDEEDISDEEMEDESDSEEDNDLDKTLWGEGYTDGEASTVKKTVTKKEERKAEEKRNEEMIPELSDAEKNLFMEEFRSNMFLSFLQGKDTNFDYSQVDYNPDYDDLKALGQDEEEKYFDGESSQDASSCDKMSDGEDLLDQYMEKLEPEPTPLQLAEKIHSLTHNET